MCYSPALNLKGNGSQSSLRNIKNHIVIKQKTIKNSIRAKGVGLHQGEKISITLRPASPDTGVIFRRADLSHPLEIPARSEYVVDTRLSTTLGKDSYSIATVEHLLSAIAGLGIDNLYIDVDTSEVPIMDGSAGPFIFLLQSAGIQEQDALKKFIRIKKTIEIIDGDKWARFEPYHGFKVSFEIDFDEHPVFSSHPKRVSLDFSSASFVKEVSRSRTFGFLKDYDKLRTLGLVKGGSLSNAIVVDDHRILNDGGLRSRDEFAKHKVLDAIGDLYLLGHNLIGSFAAKKSGHYLNNQLLKKLLTDKNAWEVIVYEKPEETPAINFIPAME